jgi:hypothetical protein
MGMYVTWVSSCLDDTDTDGFQSLWPSTSKQKQAFQMKTKAKIEKLSYLV